jgi:hypothetical protein
MVGVGSIQRHQILIWISSPSDDVVRELHSNFSGSLKVVRFIHGDRQFKSLDPFLAHEEKHV